MVHHGSVREVITHFVEECIRIGATGSVWSVVVMSIVVMSMVVMLMLMETRVGRRCGGRGLRAGH